LRCYNLSTYLINITSCISGNCSNDSTCDSCNPNFFGTKCNEKCSCLNGNCSEGINGTGLCFSCHPNYFGTICNEKCSCDEDCFDGIIGDGTCSNCSTNNLECNFTNTLSDHTITINFTDIQYYIGLLNFESSNITLKSAKIIILSNFTLNNSVIDMDINSSIIVNKCLSLTNSTLLINLDAEHKNINKSLITFDPSCSNTSNLTHSFYNSSTNSCPNLNVDSNSISVLYLICNNNKNGGGNSITWIIILVVVGSVVLLAIVVIIIVFGVPSIRTKLLSKMKK